MRSIVFHRLFDVTMRGLGKTKVVDLKLPEEFAHSHVPSELRPVDSLEEIMVIAKEATQKL